MNTDFYTVITGRKLLCEYKLDIFLYR